MLRFIPLVLTIVVVFVTYTNATPLAYTQVEVNNFEPQYVYGSTVPIVYTDVYSFYGNFEDIGFDGGGSYEDFKTPGTYTSIRNGSECIAYSPEEHIVGSVTNHNGTESYGAHSSIFFERQLTVKDVQEIDFFCNYKYTLLASTEKVNETATCILTGNVGVYKDQTFLRSVPLETGYLLVKNGEKQTITLNRNYSEILWDFIDPLYSGKLTLKTSLDLYAFTSGPSNAVPEQNAYSLAIAGLLTVFSGSLIRKKLR